MSKILGIIAEYNPFHNGHLYHLNKSKELTGADYTIAVISGNFTQRGDTSLINKWSKAEIALQNGIDLVIELPILYSVSSAENFADGAIKILNSLGIVDYISFGGETSDINLLNSIADILCDEPIEFKVLLSKELSLGLSYPKARENALIKYLNNPNNYGDILSSPNNILGIEYLKSLKKLNSSISPIVVKRYKANYNDLNFSTNIASATAIRNIIEDGYYDKVAPLLPSNSFSVLLNVIRSGNFVANLSVFEKQIIYNLRKLSVEEIAELPDVSEGLEFAIKSAANSCNTIFDFLNIIKSKRYTSTRLNRILLYSLLGITKKDIEISKETTPYVRVLGFNENGASLLSKISKSNPDLPIITSVKKFVDSNKNENLSLLLNKDIFATNVYTLGYENNSIGNLDFTKKIRTNSYNSQLI